MKRIIATFALCLLCATLSAQNRANPYMMVEGVRQTAQGVELTLPRTTLAVDLTVERETVLSGPYARYALKYLGVRVPFTDKKVYTLREARVALLADDEYLEAEPLPAPVTRVVSYLDAADGFAPVLPDRNELLQPDPEEAARRVASAIFSLRKHRMELITGEAGEHVFGAGLQAALEALAQTEQTYLELFLGKRIVDTETRRYVVAPLADKFRYLLCRFSESDGLLPENDLSGEVVLLQIESGQPLAVPEAGPKQKPTVAFRVAAPSLCSVLTGGRELTRTTLPIYEFGRTVNVYVPRND